VGVYRVHVIEEREAIEVLYEVADTLSAASIATHDVAVIAGLGTFLDTVAAAVGHRLDLTAIGEIADAWLAQTRRGAHTGIWLVKHDGLVIAAAVDRARDSVVDLGGRAS
jgi:hypothetical protein